MKTRLAAFGLVLLFVPSLSRAQGSGSSASVVAQQMIDAMGGKAAWEKARYFRFDFVVVRDGKPAATFSHWWDRYDGRYRVEGVGKDGKSWQAFFNVNTKVGEYFVDGVAATGDEKAKGLEDAYGRFINDTYWLLAPWKVFDPGVTLHGGGVVKDAAGHDCDEIQLTFDNVGLTPKDTYWMDIDRTSHRMTQWKYVLNGGGGPPTVVRWDDWRQFGPIWLSVAKPIEGRPVEIRFDNLAVSGTPDDAALTPPGK